MESVTVNNVTTSVVADIENGMEADWLIVCKYCGRTFENMESLKLHKRKIHTTCDVKPLVVAEKQAGPEPDVKVAISSKIHQASTATGISKGCSVLDMGRVETWYKCTACQEHVKGPIKFLLHQHMHEKPIPQLFHTESGAILEIHQLPNRFEIFTPKIELKPIDEICRKSEVTTNINMEIPLPKLTESRTLEVIADAEASKRHLRTRTKKRYDDVPADEEEISYPDDSKNDSDWNGSEESDSKSKKKDKVPRSRPATRKKYKPKPLKWKDELDTKTESYTYTCTLCPAPWSYHNLGLYAIHMKSHHLKEHEKYHCTSCQYTDENPHKFHEHMQGHESEAPKRTIVCRICPDNMTSFDSNFLYTKHMADNHYANGNFSCPYCPRIKLYKLYRYEKHMQKHDAMNTITDIYQKGCPTNRKKQPDHVKCTLCPEKIFKWKASLEEHMRAHERMSAKLADKPFKCTLCPAAFCSKSNLKQHSYTHLDSDSLVCKFPDCGTRLSSRFHLERHMQRHFMATLSCPICHIQCSARPTLDRHMRTYHTAEGVIRARRTRGSSGLNRVKRVVTGVKVPLDLVEKYSTRQGASDADDTNLSEREVQSKRPNLTSSTSDSTMKFTGEEDGRLELDSVHLGDLETIKKECVDAMKDVNEELDALQSNSNFVNPHSNSESTFSYSPSPLSNVPVHSPDISTASGDLYLPLTTSIKISALADHSYSYSSKSLRRTSTDGPSFDLSDLAPDPLALDADVLDQTPEFTFEQPIVIIPCGGESAGSSSTSLHKSASSESVQVQKILRNKKRKHKPLWRRSKKVTRTQIQIEKKPENRQFHCTYENCDKVYRKSSYLEIHLRRHTGEKPFICSWPECPWRFARSDELGRHYRSHTGDKCHECKVCQKRFGRSDHLTKHLKVHERSFGGESILPLLIDLHSSEIPRRGRPRKHSLPLTQSCASQPTTLLNDSDMANLDPPSSPTQIQ